MGLNWITMVRDRNERIVKAVAERDEARKERDEALEVRDYADKMLMKSLDRCVMLEETYFKYLKQRDEAVKRLLYHKKKSDERKNAIQQLQRIARDEDNLHKDFVQRYKEKADIGIRLPYPYPTDNNA